MLLFLSQSITSSEWGYYWIRSTTNDSNCQTWFRRTYVMPQRIKSATAEVVVHGYCQFFINGRNVSNDILMPYHDKQKDDAVRMIFDVGRFFQNSSDTATIAVWHAPTTPSDNENQLSLVITGRKKNEETFELHTDTTWMCHPANTITDDHWNEIINQNQYLPDWKFNDFSLSDWSYAVRCNGEQKTPNPIIVSDDRWMTRSFQVHKIHRPLHVEMKSDTLIYDFGQQYEGMIRLTIRGMHKGDTIRTDHLTYICTGIDDEQAFNRFSFTKTRFIVVTGKKLTSDNIVKAEFLELSINKRWNNFL